ncbi:MAG: hypothetical protein QOE45_494 [Frankiaceae bacterium]|nr:hypothetical protein [Frankiaceae bacterium]
MFALVPYLQITAAKKCAYTITARSKIARTGGSTITESISMTVTYNCGSFAANVTVRDELPQGLESVSATKSLSGSGTLKPATSQTVTYFTAGVAPTRPSTTVHFVYRVGRTASNYTFCFDHTYAIALGGPPTDNGVRPMTHAQCNSG